MQIFERKNFRLKSKLDFKLHNYTLKFRKKKLVFFPVIYLSTREIDTRVSCEIFCKLLLTENVPVQMTATAWIACGNFTFSLKILK